MKDRKKKKRRSGPPSQPLGFAAQPAPARMHAAQRAGLGCRCSPARPTAPPAAAATWPHASTARRPRPRVSPSQLQPLPPGPMRQPHSNTVSSSSPTPQPPTRLAPDSGGRAGQGSCPRHGPVSPLAPRPRNLRANHPTPQCRSMPTVHHQPSAVDGARAPGAIKPRPEP